MSLSLMSLLIMIFPACMAVAAVDDMRRMRISNLIPAVLVCVFPFAALMTDFGLYDFFVYHIGCAVLVLVIGFVLFCFNGMGGGDAKLLTGVALWLGWSESFLWFLLLSSIAGGVMGLVLIIMRSHFSPLYVRNHPSIAPILESGKLPFGVALAIGALMVYPTSRWFDFIITV